MRDRWRNAVASLVEIGEPDSDFGCALLQVRYRALQRQIPFLYLIALTSIGGLHVASGITWETLSHPANLMIFLVIGRLAHWVKTRTRSLTADRIVTELRTTFLLAALLSGAAGFWAITLIGEGVPSQHHFVILFASLAAIGCAYGLSSFAAAARLPLILFALPFSFALAFSPDSANGAAGVSLALVSLITLRLLDLQNRGLVDLVRSRTAVEVERVRAVQAERLAVAEKDRVRRVADTDALTGLANRRAFLRRLRERLDEDRRFTLIMMDLDGFKPINDAFGHATGDAVLVEAGRRLRQICRGVDLPARVGGDEFAVLAEAGSSRGAVAMARKIRAAIGRTYEIGGRTFEVSASIGLVNVASEETAAQATLKRSDLALYASKDRGPGSIVLFTVDLESAYDRRVQIERALRQSSTHADLRLAFQPIFCLDRGTLSGFEALARWQHPELGQVSPSEFIPLAEHIGVIGDIGDSLLRRALSAASEWPEPIGLSFNLSTLQIRSEGGAERILGILGAADFPASRLTFEVTETAFLANFEMARRNLLALRSAGSRIALDDFGAGYASFSYVRELEFDAIKLDGSLVVDAPHCARSRGMLEGVIAFCNAIRVECVAEHLTSEAHIRLLAEMGCRSGQGIGLCSPVDGQLASEIAGGRVVHLGVTRGNTSREQRRA